MSNNRILGNLATYIDSASSGGAITKVGNDFSIQAMTDSDVGGTPTTGFAGTDSASVKGLITTADIVRKGKKAKDAPGLKNVLQGNVSKLNPSVSAIYNLGDSSNPIDEIILDSSATIFFGAISLTSVLKSGTSAIAVAAAVASPVAGSAETSFLLKTDSTQSDAQVDASTNALTITQNGNVTSTAFSPYSPKMHSVYLDGSGDYLDLDFNAIGTNDFTFECWVYVTDSSANQLVFDTRPTSTDNTTGFNLQYRSNNVFSVGSYQVTYITGSTTLTDNTWYHVAVTRSGSTMTLWVNGESDGTASHSVNLTSTDMRIGTNRSAASVYNGYISDFRLVSGTAVYTSAFTAPTERLTAIANTEVLTCHLPYLADGSSNAHGITANGTSTKIEPFGPYDNIAYSPSDHGGSVHFEGSASTRDSNVDKLRYSSLLATDASTFTIEGWIYLESAATTDSDNISGFFSDHHDDSSTNYFGFGPLSNGTLALRWWSGSVGLATSTETLPLKTWNHIACVVNSNAIQFYINGVAATMGGTTTYNGVSGSSTYSSIGSNYYGSIEGYISDLRVTTTAVYTADFTPPTEPLTAISGTQLLTCTNKNSVYDAAGGNLLTLDYDATTSTTQTKYASSSMYFDGIGDHIDTGKNLHADFGTGDFTVEAWVYLDESIGSNRAIFGSGTGDSNDEFTLLVLSNGAFYFDWGDTSTQYIQQSGGTFTANAWHHVAVTRSGTQLDVWLDGTSVVSNSSHSFNYAGTSTFKIGMARNFGIYWNGYIEDVRITKGLARYTTTFTPPTAALEG